MAIGKLPRLHSLRARRASSFLFVIVTIACGAFLSAAPARAQESVVHLDPAKTQIEFTLGATFHTVHGSFRLKSGEIRFDPTTGRASGTIVADATSGMTGNSSRDANMQKRVLESGKFPEIVFTPKQMKGRVVPGETSQVEVAGALRLHGQDHELTLALTVQPSGNGAILAATHFSIPYVKWGLKDPSTFVLRVSDTVVLDVHAVGQVIAGR